VNDARFFAMDEFRTKRERERGEEDEQKSRSSAARGCVMHSAVFAFAEESGARSAASERKTERRKIDHRVSLDAHAISRLPRDGFTPNPPTRRSFLPRI